jgi:hypothetical protein
VQVGEAPAVFGVGIDANIVHASLLAIVSAVARATQGRVSVAGAEAAAA